jgi:transposase-like protein
MPSQDVYSDEFVAAALAMLRMNDGNVAKTSKRLDVPYSTLRQWMKEGVRRSQPTRTLEQIKSELSAMYQTGARKLYEAGMDRSDELSAMQAITASAISTDKFLALSGNEVNVNVRVLGAIANIDTPWQDDDDGEGDDEPVDDDVIDAQMWDEVE